MSKIFIGADPGKSGAIVVLYNTGEVFKFPFPMIGTDYDLPMINEIFADFKGSHCHVVIEDVSPIAGGSAKANWSFSRGKTILEAFCVANQLPFTLVRPKKWQKIVHEGIPKMKNPKDMTLMAIKRLYPNVDLRKSERARNPHDGIYDALAMAHYCKLMFGTNG